MLRKFCKEHANLLTIIVSGLIITAWTIYKFNIESINFDMTGQQLLARQWLHGNTLGSLMAPTNYIWKIILFYMPVVCLKINPKFALFFLTIFVNILTIVLLYIVLKKIINIFKINTKNNVFYNLSIVWFSLISGSIFWIQFSNSRNLEIVAGLLIIYLGLILYKKFTTINSFLFIILTSITYFSDPMQLYITTAILISYLLVFRFLLKENDKPKNLLKIIFCILISYFISSVVYLLTRKVTNISFFGVASIQQSLQIFHHPLTVIAQTAKNIMRLLAGGSTMGHLRQIFNLLLVFIAIVYSLFHLVKSKNNNKFLFFILCGLVITILVYIVSGQPAFKSDTSRYLIMLSPFIILLFASIDKTLNKKVRIILEILFLIVITVDLVTLMIATCNNFHYKISGEDRDKVSFDFLAQSKYPVAYASMDTAIPSTYLYGENSNKTLLPLSCDNNKLRKSTLFFDKKLFLNINKIKYIPIILDGSSITNTPYECNIANIESQIGKPKDTMLYMGNSILIYQQAQINKISF